MALPFLLRGLPRRKVLRLGGLRCLRPERALRRSVVLMIKRGQFLRRDAARVVTVSAAAQPLSESAAPRRMETLMPVAIFGARGVIVAKPLLVFMHHSCV